MVINGVRIIKQDNYSIFYIDHFSSEFKQIIREQLQGVWNGFSEADSLPEFYSYTRTVSSFLDRYDTKTDDIKKGMIAELLAHILIKNYLNELTSLSILKNKEERSIKKGFDIIYCSIKNRKLWYSEVKSGRSENGSQNSSEYNTELLNRSKRSINDIIQEKRNSLWESALIDVSLMIREDEGRDFFKNLLSGDAPSVNINQKKSVILISTLYHNLADEIDKNSVSTFFTDTVSEAIFEDVMLICIQKNTFETIANFLRDESKSI